MFAHNSLSVHFDLLTSRSNIFKLELDPNLQQASLSKMVAKEKFSWPKCDQEDGAFAVKESGYFC